MKKLFAGLLSFVLLFLVLLFPHVALQGASEGLTLWFNRIIPALLPCMILTQLCIHTGILEKLTVGEQGAAGKLSGLSGNGLYIAVLGLLCGFPMGAKLINDFYVNEKISQKEAVYLMTFCNQLSPAFLMEYVLADHFAEEHTRKLLLLSYYMSLLLLWLLCRIYFSFFHKDRRGQTKSAVFTGRQKPLKKEASQTFCLSENLDTSIMNSLETILRIGGYIVLFSVLAAGIQKLSLLPVTGNSILVSLLEITTGLGQIENCRFTPAAKGILIVSLCSFGGCSSLMQVSGVLKDSGLPVGVCFLAKMAQALLTAAVAALFLFLVL